MYCIIVTKPLVKVNRTGTAADHAMLEPGDKWVEIQEHIISRAFITKAKAERWAYRHGGIEEHDAQLVARGGTGEFDFFKGHGKFELCETSQYPARTRLLLVDLGTRELPAEPAQKKSEADGVKWCEIKWYESNAPPYQLVSNAANQLQHADICECPQCRERRTREAEQLAQLNLPGLVDGQARPETVTVTVRPDPAEQAILDRARTEREQAQLRAAQERGQERMSWMLGQTSPYWTGDAPF